MKGLENVVISTYFLESEFLQVCTTVMLFASHCLEQKEIIEKHSFNSSKLMLFLREK